MKFNCKICGDFPPGTRLEVLKHYKLEHSQAPKFPCLFEHCPVGSKNCNALKTHLCLNQRRKVATGSRADENLNFSFRCLYCEHKSVGICELISHLKQHLKENQEKNSSEKIKISCPAVTCTTLASTNRGTWASHVNRVHQSGFLACKLKSEYFVESPPSKESGEGCSSGFDDQIFHSAEIEEIWTGNMDWGRYGLGRHWGLG